MAAPRLRREPPAFRGVEVRRSAALTPHLVRIVVGGEQLEGLDPGLPAASVRILLPSAGRDDLVLPAWSGNEFLLPGGDRPVLRTLTPRRFDAAELELTVDVVAHEHGPLAAWARRARPGDPAAISGTGRGYTIDADAGGFLLAGDESAIPAISQLLEALPAGLPIDVRLEVSQPDARVGLPSHPQARTTWVDLPPGAIPGSALLEAVRTTELAPDGRVWAAGEAAAMQRIRRHLFEDRGLDRSRVVVRGYWKHGRAQGGDEI